MSFTEYKTVEKEILDSLQSKELRWRYIHGDKLTQSYRGGDEQEMLLVSLLRDKLQELNPSVITGDERADKVITHLRMLRDNREWLSWLRGEQTVSFATDEKSRNVRLIDFDHPNTNDYLCSSQVWTQGVELRRPDILL